MSKQVNVAFDDDVYARLKSLADSKDMTVVDTIRVALSSILPEKQQVSISVPGKTKIDVEAELSKIATAHHKFLIGTFTALVEDYQKLSNETEKRSPMLSLSDYPHRPYILHYQNKQYVIQPISFSATGLVQPNGMMSPCMQVSFVGLTG